jgi:hypothetical protein
MLVQPFTVPGQVVGPYVHLDNRGLVMFDGRRSAMFPAASLMWVAETFQILADEKRATRRQGDHILGGFVAEDGVQATVYGGLTDNLATLQITVDSLRALHGQIRGTT